MKASDLPSDDGVGRIEPPGPVTKGSASPVCRSRGVRTKICPLGSFLFWNVPPGGVLAPIEIAAVGGERRLAGVLLVVLLLGELQALAAGAVIEPHLSRAER